MLTPLLLTFAALAQDPAPPPPPATDPLLIVVDLAQALHAEGDDRAAGDVLDWTLQHPVTPTLQARADALRKKLPRRTEEVEPVVRLALWQTFAGAYLLGPHLVFLFYDPARNAAPYFAGAAGGAVLGAGSALWLGLGPGLPAPEATTIFDGELLGAYNGLLTGIILNDGADDDVPWSTGLLAGTLVGAGAGYGLSRLHPNAAQAVAAPSGALWGAGITTAGLVAMECCDTASQTALPLLLGSDLGTIAGLGLVKVLDADRDAVVAFDAGGVIGAGVGALVTAIVVETYDLDPEPGTVSFTVTAFALAGGAGAAALSDRRRERRFAVPVSTSLLSGERGALHVAVPVPVVAPSDRGTQGRLSLVDVRF